ncbi:MAG TPA: SPOR domain-containing protein [Paracoccus solventivorans]|uniref:SPOR domain-containing protein n=1 Tax=Paracoccus solventivorans TaxID=53463 RepID=UPI002B69470E|nr:SPOR domain-containing protein [Paracoccus solventivorans]HMM08193.1 SPOR domain-containing protein [Paracoccus solventivorans]
MWLRVVALLLYMLPGLVLAQGAETAVPRPEGPVAGALDPRRPAEPPPPDFTGRQYIDSGGCVFLRTDAGWRARLSRDGAAICGWPPTFAARGADAPPLPGAEPRAAQIERLLTETIITNLHEGELVAGEALPPVRTAGDAAANEAPPAARPDADPLGIGRMIATAPDLRRQLVGPGRAEHMCQLIGAGDPLGLCGPAENQLALAPRVPVAAAGPKFVTVAPNIPPTPLAAATAPQAALGATTPSAAAVTAPQVAPVATTPPVATAAAAQVVPAAATPPAAAAAAAQAAPAAPTPPAAAVTARRALPATTSPPPPATSPRTASPPATSPASSPVTALRTAPGPTEARPEVPLLIPPGARYLEVGAFRDPLDAHVLAQKLVAMGLPVVRSKPGQTTLSAVMVGPLEGREAMVRMADRLRKAGFARLVAR